MLEMIKKLREFTGMGIGDCKKALTEAEGDYNKALDVLKVRGAEILAKKAETRTAEQGLIDTYVHFSQGMAAMVEVNCETDFVAKDEMFIKFVKDVVTHVAAVAPKYLTVEDLPADEIAEMTDTEKKAYIKEVCLLEQSFVKNPKLTIAAYLNEIGGKFREKIVIKRFVRYALGQ